MSSLLTRSVFYYGHEVTEQNSSIDFSEGASQLNATLNVGFYSLEEYAIEIARAMNIAGTFNYVVSVNRENRSLSVMGDSPFVFLFGSGTRKGTSASNLMGFNAVDTSSTMNQVGDFGSGSEYKPQFYLQNYIDAENNQERVASTVNESASGLTIETISYGTRKLYELEIRYITEKEQGYFGEIETDLNAQSNARDFLQYITLKGNFEFMKDVNLRNDFNKVLLESTPESREGVNFKLKPFRQNMRDYLTTGTLKMRKL